MCRSLKSEEKWNKSNQQKGSCFGWGASSAASKCDGDQKGSTYPLKNWFLRNYFPDLVGSSPTSRGPGQRSADGIIYQPPWLTLWLHGRSPPSRVFTRASLLSSVWLKALARSSERHRKACRPRAAKEARVAGQEKQMTAELLFQFWEWCCFSSSLHVFVESHRFSGIRSSWWKPHCLSLLLIADRSRWWVIRQGGPASARKQLKVGSHRVWSINSSCMKLR